MWCNFKAASRLRAVGAPWQPAIRSGALRHRPSPWSRPTRWAVALLVLAVSGVHAQSVADSARPRSGTNAAKATMGPAASTAGIITVTGHVVRTDGGPISHVSVGLFGTHDTTVTRDDGGFTLHPSQPGVYMIGARGSVSARSGSRSPSRPALRKT